MIGVDHVTSCLSLIESCEHLTTTYEGSTNLHLSEKHGIKISLRIPNEHEKAAK